jgi:retron-type reverse transcriptase
MDLSKAFDCLPHDLLLLKMKFYGMSEQSLNLIKSYLSNRQQCVKIGNTCICSDYQNILKGVPQGSILEPILFNIFINDIFLFINKSQLYNYADDNTPSYSSTC